MHHQRNRHRNRFIGIIPLIFLILGVVIFLGFNIGYFPYINWTISPFVIIIILAVTIGGVSSRRRRLRQKSHENTATRTQSPYRQYEPSAVKREVQETSPATNYKYRNSYEKQFCDYCGIKLETAEQSFCVNCGQRTN